MAERGQDAYMRSLGVARHSARPLPLLAGAMAEAVACDLNAISPPPAHKAPPAFAPCTPAGTCIPVALDDQPRSAVGNGHGPLIPNPAYPRVLRLEVGAGRIEVDCSSIPLSGPTGNVPPAAPLIAHAGPVVRVLTASPLLTLFVERLGVLRNVNLIVSACRDSGLVLTFASATVGSSRILVKCDLGTRDSVVPFMAMFSPLCAATPAKAIACIQLSETACMPRASLACVGDCALVRVLLPPPPAEWREGYSADEREYTPDVRRESGLTMRAAVQRHAERTQLRDASLHCRVCGARSLAALPGIARAAPDVDSASMLDFAQCCHEMTFNWTCAFPIDVKRAYAKDTATSRLLSDQTVLLSNSLPDTPHTPRARRGSWFDAPRSCLNGTSAVRWQELACSGCGAVLGVATAQAVDSEPFRAAAPATSPTSCALSRPPPASFEEQVAPGVPFCVQLLKCALVALSSEAILSPSVANRLPLLSAYTPDALLAWRMLREAEGSGDAATFALLSAGGGAVRMLITLLNKSVALVLNTASSKPLDTVKVAYTKPKQPRHDLRDAHPLSLPEVHCVAVLEQLASSTCTLPRALQQLGGQRIGFLCIASILD